MKRIFTILAFTVLTAISSFGQSSYEYEVEYIYDETTGDTSEFIHIYGEIEIDTTVEYVKPREEPIERPPFYDIDQGMIMVFHTSQIKVYDIRGRLINVSYGEFCVWSLPKNGVYIIVTEYGVLKYNSVWRVCTKVEHNYKHKNVKPLK